MAPLLASVTLTALRGDLGLQTLLPGLGLEKLSPESLSSLPKALPHPQKIIPALWAAQEGTLQVTQRVGLRGDYSAEWRWIHRTEDHRGAFMSKFVWRPWCRWPVCGAGGLWAHLGAWCHRCIGCTWGVGFICMASSTIWSNWEAFFNTSFLAHKVLSEDRF